MNLQKNRRTILALAALLCFGFRVAGALDESMPKYYSVRGDLLPDGTRKVVNFDTWGSIEMYSTATVVSKSSNSYAFAVTAPNAYYPQSGHELTYQLIVTTQGYVGIATASPAGLFTVGNGTLTVTSAGNVGIGMTNPGSYKLNVNGNVNATAYYGSGANLTNLPSGGRIVQILQGTKTDAYTTTNTSYTIPPGLSVTITPTSASSKILIMVNVNFQISGDSGHGYGRLQRDGNALFVGDAAGSRNQATFVENSLGGNGNPTFSMDYVDSPNSTSPLIYSFAVKSSNGTTLYLNRSVRDNDGSAYDGRTCSSIIVMEITQ